MEGRILIIDEDRELAEMLQKQLSLQGYLVSIYAYGQLGLNAVSGESIDTILTAMRLPDLSGIDLCREMSARLPEIPVVIMTAFGSMEAAIAAIRAGAEMWQHQADTHVKAAGIVPADFYEWARESSPDALKQAIQGQLFGRSLKGYTDLMNSYLDSVPPTLEALQRGGIPTKEQGGKTFVQLGGSWMTLDAAVKARLV